MQLGLGLPLSGRAATADSGGPPSDFYGGTYTEGWWPTSGGDGNLWQDTGKTIEATDGGIVKRISSITSGPDISNVSDPRWDEGVGLLDYNTSTGISQVPLSSRHSDMYIAFVINTTVGTVMVGQTAGFNNYMLYAQDGSTAGHQLGAGTPTYLINGVETALADRNAVYDNICTGETKLVEIVGCDLSAAGWATVTFGRLFSTGSINDFFGDITIIENPDAAARASIRSYLLARHGL